VAVSSLCAPLGGLSPRSPPSAVSEGRSRALWRLGGRRLMGSAGCRGAFGVTLQFALALIERGFCPRGGSPQGSSTARRASAVTRRA